MLSRILGLIRDIIIARYFGSSEFADTFFIAFRIPNLLRRLFAEGAFSQAFVPVLSEYKEKKDKEQVKEFIDHVAGTLGLILLVLSVAGILSAPLLIYIFAPGFYDDPEKLRLTSHMLQITFPYLLLISLTALAAAIMNTYSYFALAAFTPAFLNISLIGATLLLTPWFTPAVFALAWGVMIAGISQLSLQLPFLYRIGLFPRPRWGWHHSGVRKILKLMIPALFGVSVSQISLLLDSVIASFLPTGSISWLYYSDRISELPLGVFGVAIGSVILPSLSKYHAKADKMAFSKTLDWAIRLIILIAIPASVGLFILSEPVLATLFHYGVMTDHDILMTGKSLKAFSLGLTAFMLIKVLAPGYFSRQNVTAPVKIAVKALSMNMLLNLIFVWPLAHAGLALATSLSSALNAWLLYCGLRKDKIFTPEAGTFLFVTKVIIAAGIMGIVLFFFKAPVTDWLHWSAYEQIYHLSILIVGGLIVYILSLLLSGIKWQHLRQ